MRVGIYCIVLFVLEGALFQLAANPLPKRQAVLGQARHMLETWSISYVLGGHTVGDIADCELCNSCLADKKPISSERLQTCPSCSRCSLDCSHFIYEVFKQAQLRSEYLTTATMNRSSAQTLLKTYSLVDIGNRAQRALPGDLLVFDGHVVMLEKKHGNGTADIIHVTSGKDLRGPGLGIQRERHVSIESYRGPLLRILRHIDLANELREFVARRSSRNGYSKD